VTAAPTWPGTRQRARQAIRADGGQATVELALALPVLCLLLLGIVQLLVVASDQLAVIQAARVGARAAAVAADPASTGAPAAIRAGPTSAHASVSIGDGVVTVTVSVVNHTDVPLIGALLPDIVVTGSAAMQLEPP